MKRLLVALCVLYVAFAPARASGQPLSREEQAEFLRTARIVHSEPIGKGVTHPYRLTLTNGTLTHDAAFQSVDEQKIKSHTGPRRTLQLRFVDSWRYNVAAHRLAALLGIPEMVPVSVQRTWDGKIGALTWWVDDVLMDDQERRKTGAAPPDDADWIRQQFRMTVFTQLAYDTDRNQGNILITKDWRVVMIDFTRAFRTFKTPPEPLPALRRCDRVMLAGMRGLTKEKLAEAAGTYLSRYEVEALIARRDLIVSHFDKLVAQFGEANVLY